MSLYDQPIPNLIGGVSQQPPLARYINQLGESVNAVADPVEGLGKRPPFEHVARLTSGLNAVPPAVFLIDRDQDNRYVALVGSGSVRVFDIEDGTERSVAGDFGAYLSAPVPRRDFRSLTIADYTILLNRTVSTARLADTAPTRPYEGIVFVRAGAYGRTYRIELTIGGSTKVGGYLTPDGSQSTHAVMIGTQAIAEQVKNSLSSNLTGTGVTVTQYGSVLYFSHPSQDFQLAVEDGQGGEAMRALKDNIQRFSDLPRVAPEGLVLRVAGDPTFIVAGHAATASMTSRIANSSTKTGAAIRFASDGMTKGERFAVGAGTALVADIPLEGANTEEEREAYLNERFTWEQFAKGLMYYNAHGSLAPNVYDGAMFLGQQAGLPVEPYFQQTRGSGLPGDPFTGNPTYSRISKAPKVLGELADGTPFSEQDVAGVVKHFAPLGNHIAMNALLDRIFEFLPDEEGSVEDEAQN
ncbi:hypothetical protein ACQKH5_07175 [Hyphomonas sp. NPDC076900]|uniref:phage nozzle protein n=1 Tax=Hyphomonas sp. NPDC076900 TaxID=3390570 RepID=UPI003D01872A